MRSSTSRSAIVVSTIVIIMLVAAQLMWLFKIYQYEQKEFRTSVIKSMRGVYEELELLEFSTIRLQKLVLEPDDNTFVMKVHCIPGKEVLTNAVIHNLEDFGIFADCHVVVFDKDKKNILYQSYLPTIGSSQINSDVVNTTVRDYSYIMLYFPHVNWYIIKAMGWWIFSMVLILLVMVALGLSMYYLYRQKFINEIQHDFIRNVTHEFQTPLTTLTVGLDALSKPFVTEQPEKRKHYLQLMQAQTSYLKHHIENLMKVLKAESNGLVMDRVKLSPLDLLHKAIHQLDFSIQEKQAIITFDRAEKCMVNADPSSLFLAILNLISNAIKYSQKPEIHISCYQQNHHCIISIKDNGIGIADQYAKKIFKKFFRVTEGDVHDVKGLGLGLYFTKKVIDGHNGTIRLISAPGKGSEFIIEIPA